MDGGMCAEKDIPDMDSVEESLSIMLDSITVSCIPLTIEIWHQETDKMVERRTYSLKTKVWYNE
jgi:hypothetical protein